MSWRTVVISSRCKLDSKMGYMVIRSEEVRRIHLDEIAVLIIENPAIELVREFDREKLFIFVNMRAYYSDEEMTLFYDTVIGHGFHIFMVDSFDVGKIPAERRTIIDQDLCEI